MNAVFAPRDFDAERRALQSQLATADAISRVAIQAQIAHLDRVERESTAAKAERLRVESAQLDEGAAKTAASRAKYERANGLLRSGVEVTDERSKAHALTALMCQAKIDLAYADIRADKLHPVHSTERLETYIAEQRAERPELREHIDRCVIPKFASDAELAWLESQLFAYVPPAAPPPPRPAADPEYVRIASEVAKACYAQGATLTWVDDAGHVISINPVVNQPPSKEHVLAAVQRGATLAWTPGAGRRVTPPAIEGFAGSRWDSAPGSDGWVLVVDASDGDE